MPEMMESLSKTNEKLIPPCWPDDVGHVIPLVSQGPLPPAGTFTRDQSSRCDDAADVSTTNTHFLHARYHSPHQQVEIIVKWTEILKDENGVITSEDKESPIMVYLASVSEDLEPFYGSLLFCHIRACTAGATCRLLSLIPTPHRPDLSLWPRGKPYMVR